MPVLFVHGGTASAREWRPVLPLLAGHAECVAIDRLGCGESDRSARGYDRATITDGLGTVLVACRQSHPKELCRSATRSQPCVVVGYNGERQRDGATGPVEGHR